MMRSASEFMASTLNDVLSMQKIEEGKMEVDMRSFILSDAVSSVLNTFRGAAVRKGVQLLLTVQKEVPFRVLGDRFKLEHSIANLVSNAIKFSPREGTVRVLVSAVLFNDSYSESMSSNFPAPTPTPTSAPVVPLSSSSSSAAPLYGEWASVVVEVRDDGPGISPENQRRLFGDFVQINAGELQRGQGSGLGLSLCKQMVELQGGKLSLTSEEGAGSIFRISVPLAIVCAHNHPTPNSNPNPNQEIANSNSDIEDNRNIQNDANNMNFHNTNFDGNNYHNNGPLLSAGISPSDSIPPALVALVVDG